MDATTRDGRRLVPRRATLSVRTGLAESRVLLVQGARQVGKSTLVQQIAAEHPGATFRSLDDPNLRAAAEADPQGFVAAPDLLVIDEVQRVPELLLSIKLEVDERPRPGRFLLTGSARVLAMRAVPDALPGRMQTIDLWPFSQGEIDRSADQFVEALYRFGPEVQHRSELGRAEYAHRIVQGGFPEAVARATPDGRRRYFRSYVSDILQREVTEIGEIERLRELRTMVALLAARTGGLLVVDPIASDVRLAAGTVRRYLTLLQEVFLISMLPAWSRNLTTRAVGTPKVWFVDCGIAASLVNQDAESLVAPGNNAFGPLMENFVVGEVARQLSWSDEPIEMFHYRTRDGVEVDLVLEHPSRGIVGIEVKAAATVRANDFRGLRHLADRLGDEFRVGIVLYGGRDTLSFGPRMLAIPISSVWELRSTTTRDD